MRPTALNLAKSVSKRSSRLQRASGELLPPIPLYRRLLRAHRNLPNEMRFLGDSYVKSEFRATRSTDNPIHIIGFLSQWKVYLDSMQTANLKPGEYFNGRPLEEEYFDKLSDEQAGQLYEFMHAAKDIWKSPEELEAGASRAEAEENSPTAENSSSTDKPTHELSSSSSIAPDMSPPSEMSDPYPLPLSQPSLAEGSDQVKDDLDGLPKPLDRTGEDEKTMRARLVYQTRKRGTLETDLILSTFAKEHLDTMSVEQMKQFDKLLDEPDWDIFYWSLGKREPPAKWKDTEILARLRTHAQNHGRVTRSMPNLF